MNGNKTQRADEKAIVKTLRNYQPGSMKTESICYADKNNEKFEMIYYATRTKVTTLLEGEIVSAVQDVAKMGPQA